ncbi:MAG TPA: DUF2798 domain-containing protein [Humidesulfovibrio sp.]|uniref:DUF2798 domain-containing protein n=1 Tax=Humidesulfovibrio sp. TaxID=2910988 RepID=UPI002C47FB86|nr:DUF2798 domain-containing protein [Humidesulfovibrio sp.]HWR02736.1 DUF2798 domain-containing protein [Humidesulfovibrio sp.]
MRKLPARYASVLTPFILTGLMTCLVSGISTVASLGCGAHLPGAWMRAWALSWAVAFPFMYFMLPVVRRVVALFVHER